MPQEPKKRHSRARQGKRRHAIHLTLASLSTCANCGIKHVSHSVCPQCGFYKGVQIKGTTKTPLTPTQEAPSTA